MMYKGTALKEWKFTSKKAFIYIALACVINYAIWSVASGNWLIVEL